MKSIGRYKKSFKEYSKDGENEMVEQLGLLKDEMSLHVCVLHEFVGFKSR